MDGKDVRAIQELAGHSDARATLRIYAHATKERLRKAVEDETLGGAIEDMPEAGRTGVIDLECLGKGVLGDF